MATIYPSNSSSELYELLNDIAVIQRINIQRLHWTGHIVQMEECMLGTDAVAVIQRINIQRLHWPGHVVRMEECLLGTDAVAFRVLKRKVLRKIFGPVQVGDGFLNPPTQGCVNCSKR